MKIYVKLFIFKKINIEEKVKRVNFSYEKTSTKNFQYYVVKSYHIII
jgi:hypothetical protein